MSEAPAPNNYPIDRDILMIPERIIEDYSTEASAILRFAFDTIWQSLGYPRSENYDEHGQWIRDRK